MALCLGLSASMASSLHSLLSALPVFFLSHGGGPAHFMDGRGSMFNDIDRHSPSAKFMKSLPKIVDSHSSTPIRCILVVSAHWEESVFTVDYQEGPTRLVYDYYGFPPETYAPHLTYPVKTDLEIADRVYSLIKAAGLPCKKQNRGFDHGTFIPLKVAYPDANVPVVQLSLKSNLDILDHIHLGEILQPLRQEGVLIVGSGQITHNLGALRGGGRTDSKTIAFTEWVNEFLKNSNTANYAERKQIFANIETLAPNYRDAHPREEHFIPLAVAFGAAFGGQQSVETVSDRIYQEVVMGTMAIDSYMFSTSTSCSNVSV
jgi:aromatic ring-opening dioxygenase catalytic subunit (LigB family)